MSDSLEIRGARKQRVIGKVASWAMRVMGWTLRYRFIGIDEMVAKHHDQPVIFSLWHSRILAMPYTRPILSRDRELVVLTSASKDGAILETAVASFGLGAVRGSSSRRGAAALVALRKKVKAGSNICITPDGPKGPKQVLQPGIIKLAQACGVPIVAVNVEFSKCWKLKTWDEFCIPRPFCKVYVTLNEGVAIPRDLDEDSFEEYRSKVEGLMNQSHLKK